MSGYPDEEIKELKIDFGEEGFKMIERIEQKVNELIQALNWLRIKCD